MLMRGYALACLIVASPVLATEQVQARTARAEAPQFGLPFLGAPNVAVQPRQSRRARARTAMVVSAPASMGDDRYMGAQAAATAVAAPSLIQPAFAPAVAPRERVATGAPPSSYAALVSRHAAAHGIPESLVHRVIMRESRYNPRAVSKGNYGMMQIRLGTARAMGYTGSAAGLLDADTNMTYAVKYLAGAYRVAGGNPSRAVGLYASGYYYHAKRQGVTIQQAAAPATVPTAGFAMASTDGFAPAEMMVQPRRRSRR
jgi:soluble lytic murein transglycosylase-like protein